MIIDIGNPTHCLRDCPVCDCERMVCKADPFARHVDWTTDTVPDWCPAKIEREYVRKRRAKNKDSITANREVRAYSIKKGVLLWEIAEAIGISDSSFSRKLRRELPAEERERILAIIDQIAAEREETK